MISNGSIDFLLAVMLDGFSPDSLYRREILGSFAGPVQTLRPVTSARGGELVPWAGSRDPQQSHRAIISIRQRRKIDGTQAAVADCASAGCRDGVRGRVSHPERVVCCARRVGHRHETTCRGTRRSRRALSGYSGFEKTRSFHFLDEASLLCNCFSPVQLTNFGSYRLSFVRCTRCGLVAHKACSKLTRRPIDLL
jgi:hypothetical protein